MIVIASRDMVVEGTSPPIQVLVLLNLPEVTATNELPDAAILQAIAITRKHVLRK